MTFLFRWTLRLLLLTAALAALALALAWHLASRSLPHYEARVEVEGVSAPVEIVRDTVAVPHIFGESDADVFFGLGYAHAQDRLWQMTMLRRTAQGRLSELFGQRTVGIDEVMRRLDLYRLAARSVAAQDPGTVAALEAYSAGVNARLAEINAGAHGRGAPEFFLFRPEIARWQPADSIAVQKLMALQLSSQIGREVLRARVALTVAPERLADILPDAPGEGVAALPEVTWLAPGPVSRRLADWRDDPLSPIAPPAFAGASNAWAAAPSRSAAGGTLLASDPHLGLTAPSVWYLARLELSSGPVLGGTIPGLPLILVGRSDALAWGLTTANIDDTDLYLERLDPDDPARYRTASGDYAAFRTEPSILRVADGGPITLTLRWSDRGPVLPVHLYDLASVTPEGHAVSLSSTMLSDRDSSVSAGMALMRARDVEAAIAAGEAHVAPGQNLILADRHRIAMQTIGEIPLRDPDHATLGRLPSPGWQAENHWQGRLDYEDNPRFLDPEGGIVGNTNNKVVDRPFPMHVSFDWGDEIRWQRWQRLMQQRRVHTRQSFIDAQLDTVSGTARTLLPLVGAELWYAGEAAAPESVPGRRRRAVDLLAEWDGEMNEHMPEPLIYAAWMRALQRRLIEDDLGSRLAAQFRHPEPLFLERVFRDVDGAAAWCDVAQTTAVETCPQMARLALDDALQWIGETHGGTLESLRWGDAHVARHDHEVLGDVPLLDWLVNIRQSTSGGDDTLMRGLTSGHGDTPFHNVHAAGYRGVYDMADPESSLFVISTGQSGHPLSRFYDNLGDLWRRGEYIPMTLDEDLARAASVGVTVLEPAMP